MKKLSLLLAFVALTMFVACNGGDDPVVTNLELDGDTIAEFEGYYDDYGTYYYGTPLRSEVSELPDTHRKYVVMLTDGEFIEDCWPTNKTFYMWIDLYSPDIEEGSFVNGSYEFSLDGFGGDKTGMKFGSFLAYFNSSDTYYYDADGTITISGTFPNITAKVDLDVYYEGGVAREEVVGTFHTLIGTFKGTLADQSLCN